ncbi:MAG: hypothetical protein MAG581_02762 [Deltaproteobacteria bacterium]|jgi:hypothetical protein|nr:hypothetical protein [Deltaproteobacteria bacterium]
MLNYSFAVGKESEDTQGNRCKLAVNQNTEYQVTGIYGSPLESEWHPAAAYVLIREMYRFEVLRREFQQKTELWRFEFAEMSVGKTIVFVYHQIQLAGYCGGPNAFFVIKK